MNKDPFKEYIKESEPDKRDKGYAWHTAIGLQAVDGLKTSEYLVQTAVRNIEGEISFEEAKMRSCKAIMRRILPVTRMTAPRRRIKSRPESRHFFQRRLSALLQTSIFPFTGSCLTVFILMPGAFGITTSRRRNGC